jgi:putative membrane protein
METIGVHFGQDWGMGPGMMGPGMGWYGFGFFGFFLMLLFWAAVIVGIAYLIRWIAHGRVEKKPGDEAMDILRKRFASGEMGKEEFEERKKALEGK